MRAWEDLELCSFNVKTEQVYLEDTHESEVLAEWSAWDADGTDVFSVPLLKKTGFCNVHSSSNCRALPSELQERFMFTGWRDV